MAPVLLFGGTFDPVHRAHLAMADEAMDCLGVDRLTLIPAGDPPHRPPPGAAAEHRLAMLQRACAGDARLRIDARELRRSGPSFSLLTLGECRAELGSEVPLVLVLGSDAAAGLGSWHGAGQLSALCHLLVLQRPDAELDERIPQRLGWARVAQAAGLSEQPAGRWYLHRGSAWALSASALRRGLSEGAAAAEQGLDPAVLDYVRSHRLYR